MLGSKSDGRGVTHDEIANNSPSPASGAGSGGDESLHADAGRSGPMLFTDLDSKRNHAWVLTYLNTLP